MKHNNQNGSTLPAMLFLISILSIIIAVIVNFAMPSEPTITTIATVLETETTKSESSSRFGDIVYYHCELYVLEEDAKAHTKYRFNVNNEIESKVYCDALEKDKQYLFTRYEKKGTKLTTVTDYKIIEKP